ncbi:hypothetical protein [Romboutsia sp. MSSM.1001216sp_RTP31141st1_F12_RTP31141_220114]|uniref:hypothetical protein n=1 Tax=Romboutsia sp. MSSM.1001216sp_RTP31141st1_F12_RTP31141_220114 TaxID=3141594 RepID=UPI0031B5C1D0
MIFTISLIGKLIPNFISSHTNKTIFFLVMLWLLEFLFLTIICDRALYKNVKYAEPADRIEFRQAIISNNIWTNFGDKKVTFRKKIFAWAITILCVFMGIIFIPIAYNMYLNGELSEGKDRFMLLLGGFLPFLTFFFIWGNNIIRWFNVVEKYQKRKIKYQKKVE